MQSAAWHHDAEIIVKWTLYSTDTKADAGCLKQWQPTEHNNCLVNHIQPPKAGSEPNFLEDMQQPIN